MKQYKYNSMILKIKYNPSKNFVLDYIFSFHLTQTQFIDP